MDGWWLHLASGLRHLGKLRSQSIRHGKKTYMKVLFEHLKLRLGLSVLYFSMKERTILFGPDVQIKQIPSHLKN